MIKTKTNTRDRILELLKKEASLSVVALTERLAITHMAVRKHLAILENDGLITSTEIKQPMGRPLQVYSLTEKGEHIFPKNYEGITVEFLRDIQEIHGEESIQLLFEKRENRLTQEYKNRMNEKTASEKIEEIVKIQNEKGYMASASKLDDSTFELIEYNCPIYSVAQEFKTACRCETEMFKNVLETEHVRRVSCKTEGDHHCKFKLKFE
ncbi:helix-turn-helix transcriptional regulator [Ureibacillus chungkukjangi]|uniref:Transcriptional regulator n=1 Tax=Ureibacillus chungkukjangi TaxID=1202712 RepID=A0A318TH96_9BACL|nr:metalloregulator ArsR/SmtB family transcription factor [Ureibacillus chungkukjangi]MCM3389432.1 transcriptional regulator [Ureibacillus chungkukjangi]PYF02468.1 transcriptional regulator [Ureibacillus chungkukjangi]